jgi:hypothetical protein
VYVPIVSSASDLCCIHEFHVANVSCFRCMFIESWGMARALGEGAWRDRGWQMGRTTRLGSCGRGVLVLIRASGSRPHGEREGGVRGKPRHSVLGSILVRFLGF